MSCGCLQLDIKLLQYIFVSMHQINIHQTTQDLVYVTKLHFCRHYGKGVEILLPQVVAESGQPGKDPTTGIETAPSHKEKYRIL